jgi:hypothetical protein
MSPTLTCYECAHCTPIDNWTSSPTDECPCNRDPFAHYHGSCFKFQLRNPKPPIPQRKPDA